MNWHPDVQRVQSLHQIVQRTPEWYDAREGMLTASDVASALGDNPYKSRQSLLVSKVEPPKEYASSFATAHGNKYEDEARLLFGEVYGLETWEVGLFRHPEIGWIGGSPDGIASDGSLIEIKCPVKRKIEHKIPGYYYPQVQICMEVLDISMCYFIQYKPETTFGPAEMDVLKVWRSKEWFANALPHLDSFWKDVTRYRANPETLVRRSYNRKAKEPTPEPSEKPPPRCLIVDDPEDYSDTETEHE